MAQPPPIRLTHTSIKKNVTVAMVQQEHIDRGLRLPVGKQLVQQHVIHPFKQLRRHYLWTILDAQKRIARTTGQRRHGIEMLSSSFLLRMVTEKRNKQNTQQTCRQNKNNNLFHIN